MGASFAGDDEGEGMKPEAPASVRIWSTRESAAEVVAGMGAVEVLVEVAMGAEDPFPAVTVTVAGVGVVEVEGIAAAA